MIPVCSDTESLQDSKIGKSNNVLSAALYVVKGSLKVVIKFEVITESWVCITLVGRWRWLEISMLVKAICSNIKLITLKI